MREQGRIWRNQNMSAKKYLPKIILLMLFLIAMQGIYILYRSVSYPNARIVSAGAYRSVKLVGEYRIDDEQEWKPLAEETLRDINLRSTLHFDQKIPENEQLAMTINNLQVRMWINGEDVYKYGTPEQNPQWMKSSGNTTDALQSPGITPVDEVELELKGIYDSSFHSFDEFLNGFRAGNEYNIFAELERDHAVSMMTGVAVFMVGLVLLTIGIISCILQIPDYEGNLYLAAFMLSTGVWMVMIRAYAMYYIPFPLFTDLLNIISIMMILLTGILYLMTLLSHEIWLLMAIDLLMTIAITMVLLMLQITGVRDLHETIIMTMVETILAAALSLYCMIAEIIKYKNEKLSKIIVPYIIAIVCLFGDGVCRNILGMQYFAVFRVCFLLAMLVVLFQSFKKIAVWIEKVKNMQKMEAELTQARISVMMSQIKPHFLFNSLNAISGLCLSDPLKADEAICTFSDYLRENIRSLGNQEPVPFEYELQHIRNYVKIEKMRFGEKLNVVYEIEYSNFKVPTLALQPIVENAIKHGVTKKAAGGTVTLTTKYDKGYAVITVRDDGVGFDVKKLGEKSDSVGMENAMSRLKYMMNGIMTIHSTPGEGTVVEIRIPSWEEN